MLFSRSLSLSLQCLITINFVYIKTILMFEWFLITLKRKQNTFGILFLTQPLTLTLGWHLKELVDWKNKQSNKLKFEIKILNRKLHSIHYWWEEMKSNQDGLIWIINLKLPTKQMVTYINDTHTHTHLLHKTMMKLHRFFTQKYLGIFSFFLSLFLCVT